MNLLNDTSLVPYFMFRKILPIILINFFAFQSMSQNPNFEIQGHRGCRGLMPENTISAFKKAIDLGITTLEMDVVVSKDLKIVVSHDPFFDPSLSTDPLGNLVNFESKGNLYKMPYAIIKKYDVGKRGNPRFLNQEKRSEYKPLLSEVIAFTQKYAKLKGVENLNYNIELKSLESEYGLSQPKVDQFSELVFKVLHKKVNAKNLCIQSFDFNVLKYWNFEILKKRNYQVDLSVLIEPEDNNDVSYNLKKLGFKPAIWSPYFKTLTAERVTELHSLGIKVIPWTVNEISDMELVKKMSCDGLITDYPDRTLKF